MYLQLLFDPGLFSFFWLYILFDTFVSCLFLCSRHFDLLLVDTCIVLTLCTTWPQKHTTWRTTGYKKKLFLFSCNMSPTWIIVCLLKSCQNLNAVYSCYIPLFWDSANISVCAYDWFFSFPLPFVKNSTLYIIYGIKHPNTYVWNFTCGFSFFIVKHVSLCVVIKMICMCTKHGLEGYSSKCIMEKHGASLTSISALA